MGPIAAAVPVRALRKTVRALRALALGPAWWLAASSAGGSARVSYGLRSLPTASDVAVGGVVKLGGLAQVFPNHARGFNLLYLVSSHLPFGAVQMARFARLRGARLVVNQNGVAYPGWHGPGWERTNAPMAALLRAADHVFYQSEFCRRSADRFLGPRLGSSEVLYNAVDTGTFTPATADAGSGDVVLLLGGTQYQAYRVFAALETLAHVVREEPRARLLVTGRLCWVPDQAAARGQAIARASELGVADRVTFSGPYTQAEAPDLFRRAHILLHTKYNDPCPTVVIEAMACGLPVVYSHSGGVPELVGDKAGVGVPAELSWERDIAPDPSALARAVLHVLAGRRSYAEAARSRAVERFDIRPWLERHRAVFEMLIA